MTGPLATAPAREELRAHLVANRIAGAVDTTRQNNLANFGLLADRDEHYLFGLRLARGSWTYDEVFALMVERVGIDPDPAHVAGADTIDPDRTLERLDAMARRLAQAAARGDRVLLATGHPAGILAIHLRVAAALAARGCPLLTPAAGWSYASADRHREIRYVGDVAMVSNRGELNHTHSSRPMEAMLAELASTGQPPPDLVVADHGWAGAAGEAGIETVGFADCNDPALFVAEAEGKVLVSVPLDDNVAPHLYAPLTAYLLAALPDPGTQADSGADADPSAGADADPSAGADAAAADGATTATDGQFPAAARASIPPR